MSQIGAIVGAMLASLAAGFPARRTDDSVIDFADRSESDLVAGVYTLISDGQPGPIEAEVEYINVMLVGQVMVAESASGGDIQEAENLMIDELKTFRRAATVKIDISSIQQSRQLELPYGWIRASLRVGPFDLTPPFDGSALTPFDLFHADWDIPSFESGAEHSNWLEEPADHATSVPDATDDVTLEQ